MTMNGYALHWVFRTKDLKAKLDFCEKVLGMHILRHEENTSA